MPSTLHTHDLILQLKAIKEEQHLSHQQIYDMIEAAGYHVSLNSIKRVFGPGSENEHFRYHDTVMPISRVLNGVFAPDKGDPELDALRADIRVKAELIDKLEHELAAQKDGALRGNAFLMHQIELKDERIDRLMSRVDGVLESNKELLLQIQRLLEKL